MIQTTRQVIAKPTRMVFWLYKIVTVGILLVGTGLDLALLLYGPKPLIQYIFTTPGELILTIWMATALVLGLVVYPYLDLHRRATRVVQKILLFYLVCLVLMHGINNLILNNTAGYLATFDAPAYPYIAAAMLFAAAAFTAGLKRKAEEYQ